MADREVIRASGGDIADRHMDRFRHFHHSVDAFMQGAVSTADDQQIIWKAERSRIFIRRTGAIGFDDLIDILCLLRGIKRSQVASFRKGVDDCVQIVFELTFSGSRIVDQKQVFCKIHFLIPHNVVLDVSSGTASTAGTSKGCAGWISRAGTSLALRRPRTTGL